MQRRLIIKIVRIALFLLGQCIIHFILYFLPSNVGGTIFNITTFMILLSLIIQLVEMKINGNAQKFLAVQKQFTMAYVFTVACMYLNFEYAFVLPSDQFQQILFSIIMSMLRFVFQNMAYSLLLLPKTQKIELMMYQITLLYWIFSTTYGMVRFIVSFNQQSTQIQSYQKDIGICLLGFVCADAALIMDLVIKGYERQKQLAQQRASKHVQQEMAIINISSLQQKIIIE